MTSTFNTPCKSMGPTPGQEIGLGIIILPSWQEHDHEGDVDGKLDGSILGKLLGTSLGSPDGLSDGLSD